MENVYKRNMKSLEKHSPFMADFFKNKMTEHEYLDKKCVEAKDGNRVLVLSTEKKTYKMNSMYSPQREAAVWAESFQLGGIEDVYILYGLGNGMFARELLKRMQEGNILVVYEPSLEVFTFVMEKFEISDLLEHNKFCLLVEGINEKHLYNILEYSMNSMQMPVQKVVALPYYKEIFNKEYDKFCEMYIEYQKDAQIMQNTILNLCSASLKNSISNIKYLVGSKDFEALKKVFPKDVPAVIVAAGPSLKENLSFLKKVKNKSVIVAVDRVLDLLVAEGIEPDFIASIDPMKEIPVSVKNGILKAPLFALPQTNTEFLHYHQGIQFIINQQGIVEELMQKVNVYEEIVDPGGSVATFICSVLLSLECERIILVGQDLAYGVNGETHASDNEEDEGDKIEAEGIGGKTVYTRYDWKSYAKFLEACIAKCPKVDFIDLKRTGLKIQGARTENEKNVLAMYCTKDIIFEKIISMVPDLLQGMKKEEMREEIQKLMAEIDSCMEILQQLVAQSKRGENVTEVIQLSQQLEEKNVMKSLNDLMLQRTINLQKQLSQSQEQGEMLSIMERIFREMSGALKEVKEELAKVLEMEIWN